MRKLRCAVYTRKSTEEGLDQAFNSLHAQREACEAYVLSQVGEGWCASPTLYDDGGYSGGDMERPALRRLLAEIDARQIDVVVVYKVDRLTRNLSDFARIVERFDKAGVSFVSVTQAFNTTSSMGRLTLNVLLSFAQFEREVTGERIRDKIAASKKKGMWMGGVPPLGYDRPTDLLTRALVVEPVEAELVRAIFHRYLQLRSVHRLAEVLAAEGVVSKRYVTLKGIQVGGGVFSRGALFHLLCNRTYLGEIVHKRDVYPGAHPAIVDRELFDQAQALLAIGRSTSDRRKVKVGTSPLKGLLFDADGEAMSPTFSQGSTGKRYRYYVSTSLQKGSKSADTSATINRIAAPALEALLRERLTRLAPSVADLARAAAGGVLLRVDALPSSLSLTLRADAAPNWVADPEASLARLRARLHADERVWVEPGEPARLRLTIAVSPRLRGGRTYYADAAGAARSRRLRPDQTLIRGLQAAHAKLEDLARPGSPTTVLSRYARNLARVACLAPDIQSAILQGSQPADLTLQQLIIGDLPLSWAEQRAALGFEALPEHRNLAGPDRRAGAPVRASTLP